MTKNPQTWSVFAILLCGNGGLFGRGIIDLLRESSSLRPKEFNVDESGD
jgi:hypothetical protein